MSKNLVFILPPKDGHLTAPQNEPARKLTHKRLAWLQILEMGPGHRNSNVGFYCMTAGWTEWNYVDAKTGEHLTSEAAAALRYDERVRTDGERLTPKGRWIAKFGRVGEVY